MSHTQHGKVIDNLKPCLSEESPSKGIETLCEVTKPSFGHEGSPNRENKETLAGVTHPSTSPTHVLLLNQAVFGHFQDLDELDFQILE